MGRAKKTPASKPPLQSKRVGNPAVPVNEALLIEQLRALGLDIHGSNATYGERLRRR